MPVSAQWVWDLGLSTALFWGSFCFFKMSLWKELLQRESASSTSVRHYVASVSSGSAIGDGSANRIPCINCFCLPVWTCRSLNRDAERHGIAWLLCAVRPLARTRRKVLRSWLQVTFLVSPQKQHDQSNLGFNSWIKAAGAVGWCCAS